MDIGIIVTVAVFGGFIAGMIAYSKQGTNSSFVVYFIFGFLLPLIGIIAACLTKRPVTTPPSWQPDPYQQATWRWWDGTEWTSTTG